MKLLTAIKLAERYFNNGKLYAKDICEHLDILRTYASRSNHITELGVRRMVSTWAFILGDPQKLVSVDIVSPSRYLKDDELFLNVVRDICKKMEIDFLFVLNDSLKINIEETDLLFIDTDHTYNQLSQELNLHGNKSRKWIILHDTESCKNELWKAIDEFLLSNKQWYIRKIYKNNNGLTILERK